MLGQVLVNLLDNAMKYTPRGGVITVSVGRISNDVLIAVGDTGIGILPEDMPHIFDRFFRGSNSRSMPGTGLGLGLAKAVVNAHGGRIEVTSTASQGTRCSVWLRADS